MLIHVCIPLGFSEETLELLLFAVKDLKQSLRDLGSDLMIRCGSAEIIIGELVKEVVKLGFLTLIFNWPGMCALQALISSLSYMHH